MLTNGILHGISLVTNYKFTVNDLQLGPTTIAEQKFRDAVKGRVALLGQNKHEFMTVSCET